MATSAADLSKQLAARQQAYRLATQDRGQWQVWMQRMLAGIGQQQPFPPAAPPVTPPAAGAPPIPAPVQPHQARVAALQKLVEMIQAHGQQYANQPQAKAIMDQVIKRLQDRITALQAAPPAGGNPAMGGWGDWLKNLTGMPGLGGVPGAAAGTPQVAGLGAGQAGIGDTGGATGWLGDILQGLTTPITTPKPPVTPTPTTPVAGATPAAGTGAGAGSYSGNEAGDVYSPTYGQQPGADQAASGGFTQADLDKAAADAAAKATADAGAKSKADSDAAAAAAKSKKYEEAANKDLQYEANLRAAAAKQPPTAEGKAQAALQTAQADKYRERAGKYVAIGGGMSMPT